MRKQKYSITDKNEITDFLNDSSGITVKLPFNPPFDWSAMIGFLAGRAIPSAAQVWRPWRAYAAMRLWMQPEMPLSGSE